METKQHYLPAGPDIDTVTNPSLDYNLNALVHYFNKFGDIYKLPCTSEAGWIYVLSHPDYIKHVFSTNHKNYTKGIGIDRVRILLGNGLMASEGELWHRQRKMIQPMVHSSKLAQFENIILKHNQALADKWQQNNNPINITKAMSELTLDFMLAVIFSEDLIAITEKHDINPFTIVTDDSDRNLQFARKFRELTTLIAEIINDRKNTNRRPFDFLSHLIDARDKKTNQPISEKQIINETMTLAIAGHETTANALNWMWYLLAKHPEVQTKLQSEIDMQLNGDKPSIDKLYKLPFVHAVVQETLRLYPPGWLLTRRSIHADKIGEFVIATNTDIFISPYIMGRHPSFWDEPNNFKPERFWQGDHQRFAYIPFAAGPRNCLGDELAQIEMQMHLAFICQQFSVSLAAEQNVEIIAHINLRPKQAIYLDVTHRN